MVMDHLGLILKQNSIFSQILHGISGHEIEVSG